MAQQRCDAETAFDPLKQTSQRRNIKLRELCSQIIDGVERASQNGGSGRF